jgi:nucleobase:cation symporter-1, NCS1 family
MPSKFSPSAIAKFLEVRQRDEAYSEQGTTRWGNRDIYPIIPSERTYGPMAFFAYWLTAGICVSSWTLGSGLVGIGLTAGQAVGAVVVGGCIASTNAYLCGKCGADHHVG